MKCLKTGDNPQWWGTIPTLEAMESHPKENLAHEENYLSYDSAGCVRVYSADQQLIFTLNNQHNAADQFDQHGEHAITVQHEQHD